MVALLAEDDAEHVRCAETSAALSKPFLTTWPVLTEAAWLLRARSDSISKLLGLLESGLVHCVELDAAAVSRMNELAQKYSDMRPQLADLSLLVVADRESLDTVFTLDHRDFSIYRNAGGQPFRLLP
jgi:predicted nucleic acid-binding protein